VTDELTLKARHLSMRLTSWSWMAPLSSSIVGFSPLPPREFPHNSTAMTRATYGQLAATEWKFGRQADRYLESSRCLVSPPLLHVSQWSRSDPK
jgi:hypothetical protein